VCVAAAGELTELEGLIARHGYSPAHIQDYYAKHSGELASRAGATASAFAKIGWLYSRHDFAGVVATIEKLGPTYVKFGQALASRADLIGVEFASALEKLQDEMEPAPIDQVRGLSSLDRMHARTNTLNSFANATFKTATDAHTSQPRRMPSLKRASTTRRQHPPANDASSHARSLARS